MAQISPAPRATGVDPEVGKEVRRRGGRLFPPAHEDQVGQLQPPGAEHPPEYGTREEAQRSARIRGRPRDAPPNRTYPQRAVSRADEQALPGRARGQGRVE